MSNEMSLIEAMNILSDLVYADGDFSSPEARAYVVVNNELIRLRKDAEK